jgi:predicted nucleic acid-binding protein
MIDDPPAAAPLAADPDDYLIALASAGGADCLVSGDRHLTGLEDSKPPVLTPRGVLELLAA